MLETLRTIKRRLPEPTQRLVEHAWAVRPGPDFLNRLMRTISPKWDHVEWLASSERPTDKTLHRLVLPRSAYAVLCLKRAPLPSRTVYITPSQKVKATAIRSFARRFGARIFVETGTFEGETVSGVASTFDRCITIELSIDYWRNARKKLGRHSNIECLHGDSGAVLQRIVPLLKQPTLFWLDAHSSGGDTVDSGVGPIFVELQTIFASTVPHIVLIDDARGHQVNAIRDVVPTTHSCVTRNDIIRITPRHFP
jgi:hypothetical protein